MNETFVGLKPSHNLLNLITTLASTNPDSTIEVKAGVEYPIQNRLNRYLSMFQNGTFTIPNFGWVRSG